MKVAPPQQNAITVHLVGGLGNQLFGYAAGFAAARTLDVPLVLDTRAARHGTTDHGLGITDFALEGTWIDESVPRTRSSRWIDARSRARARLSSLHPRISKLVGRYHSRGSESLRQLLASSRRGSSLDGYFQSWEIVREAQRLGLPSPLPLKSMSENAATWRTRAKRDFPIAVHVRLADYRNEPTFGLLAADYYLRALAYVRQRLPHSPVWLFSDEPEAAKVLVRDCGPFETPGEDLSTAAEELWVMSHCRGFVVANSTFSWWAAQSACGDSTVVVPDPWFRHGPDRSRLIPPHWTRARGAWN